MQNGEKFPTISSTSDDTPSSHPAAGIACRGGLAVQLFDDAGRIQLFPAGYFAASDGRPGNIKGVAVSSWRMLEEDAANVIATWKNRSRLTVVDYEHQTLLSEKNGQPAPAAGWITELSWEEAGLFASVNWTEKAKAHIKAGEYRYISPVFNFDPETGAVISLHSAALTNNPALDGMMEVKARENIQTGEAQMKKELLAALVAFFALKKDASEDDILAALKDKKPLEEQLREKDAELAALKEKGGQDAPDPQKFAPMELLKAQTDKVAELTAKLAELEKKADETGLSAEITAALSDGRLPKACESWARGLSKSSPETLRSYLRSAAPIAALKGVQTGSTRPEEQKAALTEDEKYVCKAAGISEEDFLAQKKKEAE